MYVCKLYHVQREFAAAFFHLNWQISAPSWGCCKSFKDALCGCEFSCSTSTDTQQIIVCANTPIADVSDVTWPQLNALHFAEPLPVCRCGESGHSVFVHFGPRRIVSCMTVDIWMASMRPSSSVHQDGDVWVPPCESTWRAVNGPEA